MTSVVIIYPPTHPYKVLLRYLDPHVGPDDFADFREYHNWEWADYDATAFDDEDEEDSSEE
jgi:hypothetical protein